MGRFPLRCQWQKQQGKTLADRAQRDRRFESYWHHSNKEVTPCELPLNRPRMYGLQKKARM